jgi:hypothetical protein
MVGIQGPIDAVLMIGFYVAVAVLVIRVRRFNLALTTIVLTTMLVIALLIQATVSDQLGAYAALGLVLMVVMVGLAVHFGAWVGGDDDSGLA